MRVTIESCEPVDKVPRTIVVAMEEMWTVYVNVYPVTFFCVTVPSDVSRLIDDEDAFLQLRS